MEVIERNGWKMNICTLFHEKVKSIRESINNGH
jgi:hypothetical protein